MFDPLQYLLVSASDPASLARVRDAIVMLIALVLSIAVHEFGHAIVADRLGDRTPRSQGRVTLNPLAHADPIGTVMLPLIGMFTHAPLIGWGRPVMVNPVAFTRKLRMRTAHMLVAIAGPAMNVVLSVVVTIIYALLLASGVLDPSSGPSNGIMHLIALNWVLAFFNLLPIPPLDGGTVLAWLVGPRHARLIDSLQQYGFVILILLLVFTPVLRIWLTPAMRIASAQIALAYQIAF